MGTNIKWLPPRKTIAKAQQELAQNCGFGNDIIWDLLSANDAAMMKKKIKQLIPDQKKGQSTIKNLRQAIFESVWDQRKYTNQASFTYLFYVMVTKNEDFSTVLNSTEYSCHPVFRCKKCDMNSDTSNCCMIYVDETGRVYQNWKSFIEENVLPAGTMVAPRKGIYNFNNENEVILDMYSTPNGSPEAKAMAIAQMGTAVMGIGAACVPIAAAISLPVAAPVMAAAGIIGLGVGAFTSITSALNLSDRKKHGQSISVSNNQARANYIGVIGGAVGVTAVGATCVMTSMAAAGKATASIEVLVNGINITSVVISGSGVANGVLDLIFKYNDDDEISSMDILNLSASLVLFTHSLYNFQLASQISNNARGNSIKSYRETLTNRLRQMFDKMSRETARIRGSKQGKMDVIRGVNEIPDRQYLNDLFKMNKTKIRLSGQKTVVIHNPTKENVNNGNAISILQNASLALPNGVLMCLEMHGKMFMQNILDGDKFQDVVSSMANNFQEETFKFIMNLARDFVEKYLKEIQQTLKLFIPTESVLYRMLIFILNNYMDLSYVSISQKGSEINKAVKTYYLKLNSSNAGKRYLCPDCYGIFSICQL